MAMQRAAVSDSQRTRRAYPSSSLRRQIHLVIQTMESKQFGSYRVVATIASGQITEVFRALQQPLEREVAIKTLKSSISLSSPFATSLEREARIIARLQHENVARLLDFGCDDQSMWLALELIEGITLGQLISQTGGVDPLCAIAIAFELARSLDYIHTCGVVHSNIRPSNILVACDGRVVLVDFGSAHVESTQSLPEPLEVDVAITAPSYMSPEQILGEQVDARSDIFSAGVVLYELLSGRRPFENSDDRTPAHSVRRSEPQILDRGTVSRTLMQIVGKCLQKNPNDRYTTAAELCAALEDAYRSMTSMPRRSVVVDALTHSSAIERTTFDDDLAPDSIVLTMRSQTMALTRGQTDRRSSGQVDRRGTGHVDNRAGGLTDRRQSGQTDRRSSGFFTRQSLEPASRASAEYQHRPSAESVGRQSGRHYVGMSTIPSGRPSTQSGVQSTGPSSVLPSGVLAGTSSGASTYQSLMPAVWMLLLMLFLVIAGGTGIRVLFRKEIQAKAESSKSTLLLAPAYAGSLLVLAQPWAYVVIDGQQVETTPFARPIPISAGTHHVTLRHPAAPDEQRVVQISRGERIVLDVTMQVRKPPKPEASVAVPNPSTSSP